MSSSAILAGKAFVALYADRTALTSDLAGAAADISGFTDTVRGAIQKVGLVSAATGTVMLASLVPALNAASDQAESLAAFEQVFRGANEEAERLASTLAQRVGRSTVGISAAMTPIGAMVTGMGLASDEAAKLSAAAAEAGLDISAFFNTSSEETFARLRSALSGSSEAVDQFGINLRKEALDKKLLEMGYAGSELEKTLARMAIIQESLGNSGAAGAAEREKESWANLSRALGDAMKDLKGAAGSAIMPVSNLLLGTLVRGTQAAAGWLREAPLVIQSFAGLGAAAIVGGAGVATFTSQTVWFLANATLAVGGVIKLAAALRASGVAAQNASVAMALYQGTAKVLGMATSKLGPVMSMIPGKSAIASVAWKVLGGAATVLTAKVALVAAAFAGVGVWFGAIHRRTGALQPLVDAFGKAWQKLSGVWSTEVMPVVSKLGALFGGLFGGQAEYWSGSIESLADVLGDVLVWAAEAAAAAITKVAEGVEWVIDAIGTLLGIDTSSREQKKAGGPAGAAQPGKDPDAGAKAEQAQKEKEDLQRWADGIKQEVRTPAEVLADTVKQLDAALKAGMIDPETYKRKKDAAEKEKADADQQEFDNSEAGKKAKELEDFAARLVDGTKTPLETFAETMRTIEEALQAGKITAEVARRGQEAAQKALDAETAKAEEAAKKASEEKNKELLDSTKTVADQRLSAARALGSDKGAKAELEALKRNFADFSKGGFKDEALATQLDYLKGVIDRSEDIDKEVKSQKGQAGQQTFSAQEALAGLGTKTIDQQLLAEQKLANEEARKAKDTLEKILKNLEG